jgi:hypothetical protein
MKMTQEHYAQLVRCVEPLVIDNKEVWQKAGLSKERFAWDMFWKSTFAEAFLNNVYDYLSDSHIETALYKIVGEY